MLLGNSLAWLTVGFIVCSTDPPPNPLAQLLIEEGVSWASDGGAELPPFVMPDGLSASDQEAVLRKVSGRYPLDEFLRDSPVARFVLDLQPLLDTRKERNGQRLYLVFVAYGSLEDVRSKKLLDQLIAVEQSASRGLTVVSRPLSEGELAERELAIPVRDGLEESYVYFSAPLLDRVQLSGVYRQVITYGERSIVAAQQLDPRFAKDAEFPNQWRPLQRAGTGEFAEGQAQPYGGLGQYAKVTALVDADGELDGRLFIEAHMVLHEPQGWFDGRNLLGVRLPTAVQDKVREFRRLLRQNSR